MTPDPLAVLPDRPQALTSTHSFPATKKAVGHGREFTAETLGDLADSDPDHVDDVVLVVDELLTNAITHTNGVRNVWVDIAIYPRWTHVAIDDHDPDVHDPDVSVITDALPESGRGLMICDALSARRWWQHRQLSKAAHAVILRTGVELTAADIVALDRLQRPA